MNVISAQRQTQNFLTHPKKFSTEKYLVVIHPLNRRELAILKANINAFRDLEIDRKQSLVYRARREHQWSKNVTSRALDLTICLGQGMGFLGGTLLFVNLNKSSKIFTPNATFLKICRIAFQVFTSLTAFFLCLTVGFCLYTAKMEKHKHYHPRDTQSVALNMYQTIDSREAQLDPN